MASMSSGGGRESPELGNSVEIIRTVTTNTDIAPYETSLCERLVQAIRSISKATARPDSPQEPTPGAKSLSEVLDEATLGIRFHAKWFSESDVADLLSASLDAAAESSASAEVLAAIHLIDNIGTYSYLPSGSLDQSVRFIAQAYYNARKARKTKQLAKKVRTTLLHILESHLGGETVETLLRIVGCEDESFLASKKGHAQTAGALMIIFQKLWLKEDVRHTVPTPDLLQLVEALQYPARNGGESLREQIMETLADLLKDEHAVTELDAECSWDILLEVVRICATSTKRSPYASAVVDSICHRIEHLEERQLSTVADLATMVGRPLTPPVSDAIVARWPASLHRETWTDGFNDLLHKLARSTFYVKELEVLARRYASIIGLAGDEDAIAIASLAQTFQECILDPDTPAANAGTLTNALIDVMLVRQLQCPNSEPTSLLDAICYAADKCIEAVRFLLRLRADAEGCIYIEPVAHNPEVSLQQINRTVFIPYLSLQQWERTIISVMEESQDWAIYDCLLNGLPELLANHALFEPRIQLVRRLSSLICEQLDDFRYKDPPPHTGLTKTYIASHLIKVLTAFVTYHRQLSKQDLKDIAAAFLTTAGSRDYVVSIPCIYALTICCYELPDLMSSYMDDVIDKMSKMVTQRYLAIHVLEFLAGLSRLPYLVRNFKRHDYKKIFGVCGSYLQSIRVTGALSERQTPASDRDGKASVDTEDALPLYVYALAHHVMIFWYLVLKPEDRPELQKYIMTCLRYQTAEGGDVVEDQGLVTIDIIDRVNAGDYRDDTHEPFSAADGRLVVRQIISGLIVITTETSLRTGSSLVTVRRASGTTTHLILGSLDRAAGPAACIEITTDTSAQDYITVMPDDQDGRTYGRVSIPRPDSVLGSPTIIELPVGEEALSRAMRSIDFVPALDSHKAGVIYVGEGQTTEDDILRNHMGSPDYIQFVEGLGTLTKLKGAKFNTQGLDKVGDYDGKHTVVWHNEVTELVFHVITLMPNNDDLKLNTASKKRHIGNDFVNIVFNNSGRPFDFDTFPSQFNTVYIVITPSARTTFLQTRQKPRDTETTDHKDTNTGFFRVKILTRPEYPNISSAADEKVISGASLSAYVRNLALNECIFSLMWAMRDRLGNEYQSSWRTRLQHIRRLRERYGKTSGV